MKPLNGSYFTAVKNAAATRTYRMAVRFGLSTADREDLHQELVLDMLERADQFDPTKGSAGTFTGLVSEHRTAEFLTDRTKDRVRLTFFSVQDAANDDDMGTVADGYPEGTTPMWTDDRDLFADSMALRDLQTALGYMNDDQVALFGLLETHQDLATACKAAGVSSATFYRRVHELQMHLRMFGFRSAA